MRLIYKRIEEENYQGRLNYIWTPPPIRVSSAQAFWHRKRSAPPTLTIISREYSEEWGPGSEPYYPVNDEKNGALYEKYRELAEKEDRDLWRKAWAVPLL